MDKEVREQIAELEHIQWQSWARVRNPEHPLLNILYTDLTEKQKDQDRVWADKILALIKELGYRRIDLSKLTVLSDKKIARALEKRKIFKGKNLEDAIDEGDRFISLAQLEHTKQEIKKQIGEMFDENHH